MKKKKFGINFELSGTRYDEMVSLLKKEEDRKEWEAYKAGISKNSASPSDGGGGSSSVNSTVPINEKNISSANENIKKFLYLLKILKISDKIDNVDIETINAIFANISTISVTFGW